MGDLDKDIMNLLKVGLRHNDRTLDSVTRPAVYSKDVKDLPIQSFIGKVL